MSGYPVLRIDEAHLQLERPDGTAALVYALPPALGFYLEVGAYVFMESGRPRTPDSIQVILSGGAKYIGRWRPEGGRQKVDAATLVPIGSTPPFRGLRPGDTVVIGVGTGLVEEGRAHLDVLWVAMASVG